MLIFKGRGVSILQPYTRLRQATPTSSWIYLCVGIVPIYIVLCQVYTHIEH